MGILERLQSLEDRVKNLECVIGGEECPTSQLTAEDDENETYMIGAYHTLSKKRTCKYFYAGAELGWSTDPQEAEEYDSDAQAFTAITKASKPPKNFNTIVLPAC